VPLGADEGVRDGSVANLDNVQLLAVNALVRHVRRADDDRWPEFCTAMASVMAC
jgi:mRNA-degrading endonuclease toxin of MazEF toxin-antitoxin module